MISIDVVIPSYRLQSEYLISIVGLEVPADTAVRFLIIADNPGIDVPQELLPYIDNQKVLLLRNNENLGASLTRNRGIDHCTAEWILFLDDDVKPSPNLFAAYRDAIKNFPGEIGFFGETIFPEPVNSFTNGLMAGEMLYFFTYAKYNEETRCATTSNVMVKRSAIGDIRFRDTFPKKGGGEDFAFSLEVNERNKKTFKSVKNAPVYHNWWHNGKRNYQQFIRWSYADFELFKMFPKITFYDFPNIAEFLIIGILVGAVAILFGFSKLVLFSILTGIVLGEFFGTAVQLLRSKGFYGLRYVHEVILVRGAADIGRMYGNMANLNFRNMFRRPNYSNFEVNYWFRIWSGLKFFTALFITASLIILFWALKYL